MYTVYTSHWQSYRHTRRARRIIAAHFESLHPSSRTSPRVYALSLREGMRDIYIVCILYIYCLWRRRRSENSSVIRRHILRQMTTLYSPSVFPRKFTILSPYYYSFNFSFFLLLCAQADFREEKEFDFFLSFSIRRRKLNLPLWNIHNIFFPCFHIFK